MAKKIIKENYITISIILFLIMIFSIIMRSSLHDKIIIFDYKVINLIGIIVNKYLTLFYRMLTNFGDFYIPCIILVCILAFLKNKWIFYLQTSCYAIVGIITYISKLLAARPRPVEALIKIPSSYSFPSGHTLTSLVFYFMLVFLLTYKLDKKKRVIYLLLTFVLSLNIAFSRVYLGVHYFSDVLGGIIIAIPCLYLFTNIINKNYNKKIK